MVDAVDAVIRVSAPDHPDAPLDLLRRGVRAVLAHEDAAGAEISLTLLDDDGIRGLNREYLDRDRSTDVLAFSLFEDGEPPVGDVYVGYPQAARQAADHGVPFDEELLRLAVHGVLHVLGHDHPVDGDREGSPMYRLQENLVAEVLGGGDGSGAEAGGPR